MSVISKTKVKFASNEWAKQKIIRGILRVVIVLAICIIMTSLSGCSNGIDNQGKDQGLNRVPTSLPSDTGIDYLGNVLGVSTFNGSLEVNSTQITVAPDKKNKNFELYMNFSDAIISNFSIQNDGKELSIEYRNIKDSKLSNINTILSIASTNKDSTKTENIEDEGHHIRQSDLGEFQVTIEQTKLSTEENTGETSEDFYDRELMDVIKDCMLESQRQDNFTWYLEIDGLGVYAFNDMASIKFDRESSNGLEINADGMEFSILKGNEDNTSKESYTIESYTIENYATVYDLDTNSFMLDTGKGLYEFVCKNTTSVDKLKDFFGVIKDG